MTKRPSLTVAVRQRLETYMAFGESKRAAKLAARAAGEQAWSFSTRRIYSIATLETYKDQAHHYAEWVRTYYGVHRLEALDERASELVPLYLQHLIEEQKSAYSIQTVRSALRMLHQDWTLGAAVAIPPRRRADITRSRGVAVRDASFNPALHRPLIDFLLATGLRRREVTGLVAGHIHEREDGSIQVEVVNGKGGKVRMVPVLPGTEAVVQRVLVGRLPNQRVFSRVPGKLDVHGYRRRYAQTYYRYLSRRTLPPSDRRLKKDDYDAQAARQVSQALGHNRLDIVLRHYLR